MGTRTAERRQTRANQPPPEPVRAPGWRVGPYQLERILGHGGMGTVYLASRADQQYEKRVAIKLVKPGASSEQLVTRFRVERQILAKLDHPNIGRMLDGGVTSDGEPYFVMEYVAGALPIDEYCDQNELKIPQRIDLFRQVCEAVQYAHRFLVVHRDIKPSNVLVSRHGAVKLMDFGIAKDLMAGTTPTAENDAGQGRSMTPHYASPEQIKGEPIGTASDVYSLGVMLYELLTGCTPYLTDERDMDELAKQVCSVDPPRPSRRLQSKAQNPIAPAEREQILKSRGIPKLRVYSAALEGDLDWIIRKAMRKDPNHRYASVEQFSEDLRRYREGLPVSAAPDSLGYRLRKIVQRHRVASAIALALLVAVVGFAVSMALLAGTVALQRDSAARERERAEQVSQFLGGMFQVSYPNEARGNSTTATEILRRAAREASSRYQSQPAVQATIFWTLGEAFRNLALPREALPLLNRALELRRHTLGPRHADVAQVLHSLGDAHTALRSFEEGEPLLREALAIRTAAEGAGSEAACAVRLSLGSLLAASGRDSDAEQLLRLAVAQLRSLGDDGVLARAQLQLASVLESRGRHHEAEDLARESLALRRKAFGEESLATAESLLVLGRALGSLDRHLIASQYVRQAREMYRRLAGEEHELTAQAHLEMAAVEERLGNAPAADLSYRQSLAVMRKLLSNENPELFAPLSRYGEFLLHQRRPAEALALLEEALQLAQRPESPHAGEAARLAALAGAARSAAATGAAAGPGRR